MNPFINAIMEKSGSMALQAELDDILGQDVDFFENIKVEESDDSGEQEEGQAEQEQEEFVDEGNEEEKEEAPKKVVKKVKKKKKKKKKRLKRSYTKREIASLRRIRKNLRKYRAKLKKAKKQYWKEQHQRRIDTLKSNRKNINLRARRRYLNKKKKGSKNELLHTLNPFAIKENAVIQGMTAEKKKSYLQQKSISSGLLVGILSTGLYSFYKREESSIHVLEDGSQMTKDQYLDYEDTTYSAMRVIETSKMPWKETIMEDPKLSGGIFAGATLLGSILANYNLNKKFK